MSRANQPGIPVLALGSQLSALRVEVKFYHSSSDSRRGFRGIKEE